MYNIIPAAYIFTHGYLKTMQQGIQPLHVVGEIFATYDSDTQGYTDAKDWALNHKTVRLLNGGITPDFLNNRDTAFRIARTNGLPFAEFIEPDCFMEVTAFGFIVTPELVFEIEQERNSRNAQSSSNGMALPSMQTKLDKPWFDPMDNFEIVQFLKKFRSAN